jgi:manganese-dependent inorganic pyrophosphatase
MQTIVIGHKNPDMDSICSALAYAELKRLSGMTDVVAARAGSTNERIDFVLDKFQFAPPQLINDLSPVVADVMEHAVVSVHEDTPLYDAIQLLERRRMRGLPVVDNSMRCTGLLSSARMTRHLFPPREEAGSSRIVTASIADIVKTLNGQVVCGAVSQEPLEHLLLVGSMREESFVERISRHQERRVVLFVGDRARIQLEAIARRLAAIVITGEYDLAPEVELAARVAGVTLITSPYDTATSVLLARGATRAGRMVETDFLSFPEDTPLQAAKERAAESVSYIFPVVDPGGRLIGILSKSDFLKEIPRQLILVDHNELEQAVRGAATVPIIEILDHHKLGGFKSNTPVLFWNNPVGSTCTIVALCYQQLGIPIPPRVAGLLMAGLIADTLNLTSPTSTPTDCTILNLLSKVAGIDSDHFAHELFSVGSPLLTLTAEQAIHSDSKVYVEAGNKFAVAQIEELTFAHFPEKREPLLAALEEQRQREGMLFSALLVTDINTQTSLLLMRGSPAFAATIEYPEYGPHIWELAGVVSRKKQLLPYLLGCLEKLPKS